MERNLKMIPNLSTSRVPGPFWGPMDTCPISRCPPKYSSEDWDFNNKLKLGISCDQERLAERIISDSRRVVEDVNDNARNWKKEVEHHMRERATEIRFLCDELNKQKKTALLEIEAISTYRDRLQNGIDFLKVKSLSICQRCIVLREGRLSVDLCNDEVDRNLQREMKVIKGCQCLLNKTMAEATDQLRQLRSTMYLLDKDLAQKDKSLLIDEKNLRLRESQDDLGAGADKALSQCLYTLGEWQQQTYLNLDSNCKELTSAAQLRCYIDLLLKQVCEDLQNQTDRTNDAFELRISELKHVKKCLEDKHNDTMVHISDIQRNISELENELKNKERGLQLCMTRLANRATRPGLEMTCDDVQNALYRELEVLKKSICKLEYKIRENKASQRYLYHIQVMQEEEINIKTNSIKIDEVDCLPLRQALKYQSF